jgi:Rrf2 family iron-sulfur cluster assembly transcriptional regulator
MFLTTKGRYAVMAMVDIATRDQSIPIRLLDVANAQEIQLQYLEQIFSKLKKCGLVTATKGPNGGYQLSREAAAIKLIEIMEAVNENVKITRCTSEARGCMNKKPSCITHDLWAGLEEHISSYFSSITLADVYQAKVEQ